MNPNLKRLYTAMCSTRVYNLKITKLANRKELKYIQNNEPMILDLYIKPGQIITREAYDLDITVTSRPVHPNKPTK